MQLIVWALLIIPSLSQGSSAAREQAPGAYFRDCTPPESGAEECARLEKFWAPRLAELGELPLPDHPEVPTVELYRFTLLGFVTEVPFATVLIRVRNDGSIDTVAARKWNDGRIEKAQKHFVTNDAIRFLTLLDWSQFTSMNSLPLRANEPSTEKDKRPRVAYRDGGDYLLEGVHSGNYHVIQRGTFRELAPDDSSWEMLSNLDHTLHQLSVWTSETAQTSK